MALTEAEHRSNDETVQRLKDLQSDLKSKVWDAAVEAAAEYDEKSIARLVELKTRIDALEWAIKSRPPRPASIVKFSF